MKQNKFSEKELLSELRKLERTSKKIIETNGYTGEAKKILILEELIKEQLKNENISYSTGKIR